MIAEYAEWGVAWTPVCEDFMAFGGTPHFSWNELNGGFQEGNPHPPWGHVRQGLKDGLEDTRALYARGGIVISSGYRCPHGNEAAGSQFLQTSRHMFGDAADMKSAAHPWTFQEHELLRLAAIEASSTWQSVWGTYPGNHLHADWRAGTPS